jgi:hypothetical protein
MTPGNYIFTGALTLSGGGLLADSDQTLTASPGGLIEADWGGNADSDTAGATDSDSGGMSDSGGNKASYTTMVLTDTSKSWSTTGCPAACPWKNYVVTVNNETGIVASNTATTLTLTGAGWSNGTPPSKAAYAMAKSGYTTTTLVDGSKTWSTTGCPASCPWKNYVVTVNGETGIVASNSATALTVTAAGWSNGTPPATSAYTLARIGYTLTTLVDGSKSWSTTGCPGSCPWKNYVVTVNGTTGIVASNSATALTLTAAGWSNGTPPAFATYSVAKSGFTPTALVDGSKSWSTTGCPGSCPWKNYVVTVNGETGIVASNTATTLTLTAAGWSRGVTPSPGNTYAVATTGYAQTSSGLQTVVDPLTVDGGAGSPSVWPANYWDGDLVTVTSGPSAGETGTVQSNTGDTLTLTASGWSAGTTPTAGSTLSVLSPSVIYLACPTAPPFWACADVGQAGGSISTSGNARLNILPSASGIYAGIGLFSDPNLIDPNAASCRLLMGSCVLNVGGNGGNFGGTIYLPRGTLYACGGGVSGTGVSSQGRVVVSDVLLCGNGNADLNLTGTISGGGSPSCLLYNDTLTGREPSGSSQTGRVEFETGCTSAGLNGNGGTTRSTIIDFAYGP